MGDVFTCDLSMPRIGLEGHQATTRGERSSHPNGAVTAEDADLKNAAVSSYRQSGMIPGVPTQTPSHSSSTLT